MNSTPEDAEPRTPDEADVRASREKDTSVESDPERDAAQIEWDRTTALDDGADAPDPSTATGDDPAQIPADDDEIPAADLPIDDAQPETRGNDPVIAELGEDGEGDLAPEDV